MKVRGTCVEKQEVGSVGGIKGRETGEVGLGSLCGALYVMLKNLKVILYDKGIYL